MEAQRNDNVVFVGRKPVMSYVLTCLTLFQNGTDDITLKARGRAISKAVDAAQILTKKFVPGLTVSSVELGTEMVRNVDSGLASDVSSMEIHLSR
jgi:archaea-specific DNA-binding protein